MNEKMGVRCCYLIRSMVTFETSEVVKYGVTSGAMELVGAVVDRIWMVKADVHEQRESK